MLGKNKKIRKDDDSNECHEVTKILNNDGVQIVDVDNMDNFILTKLSQLKEQFPAGKSWAKRIINTFNSSFFNSVTLISQNKGEGCRRHKHPDCDEFWVILSGKMKIRIGDELEETVVSEGDIIYLKKGLLHKLTVVSDEQGIRLSVSVEKMRHIYSEVDK